MNFWSILDFFDFLIFRALCAPKVRKVPRKSLRGGSKTRVGRDPRRSRVRDSSRYESAASIDAYNRVIARQRTACLAGIYYVFSDSRFRAPLLYATPRISRNPLIFSRMQGLPRGRHVLWTDWQGGFLSRERRWNERGIQAAAAAQPTDEGSVAALPPGTGRPAGQLPAAAHQYLWTGIFLGAPLPLFLLFPFLSPFLLSEELN